jgi:hypothetical protein
MAVSEKASSDCYSVHAYQENGLNIKEFVDPQTDKTFLVTASGYKYANLQILLGQGHFQDYQRAQKLRSGQSQRKSRHYRLNEVATGSLHVRVSATTRIKRSRAFLSTEIPACVTNVEDLK